MTLVVCVDDNNGILFNNRRQSRDIRVCERILEMCSENNLIVSAYSAKLFPNGACKVFDDIFASAAGDDWIFAECEVTAAILEETDRLVIYHWNRAYPSDVKIPMKNVESLFKRVSVFDFSGNSHERITEEVYIRET